MNRLELSDEESQILLQVLENQLKELRNEIIHTDHRSFRDLLRRRDDVLTRIMDRLNPVRSL